MLFFILAALAVNSSSAVQPPLPLSPANLPAQFPPKIGDCPYCLATYVRLKGLDENYRHKALSALSCSKGIRYVELAPEGIVWGYTEAGKWMILILNCQDECVVHLTYVSWVRIDQDLEDEMDSVLDKITMAESAFEIIDTRKGKRDIELEKKLPVIFWHIESRPVNSLTNHYRHFSDVAALFMEKHGYVATTKPYTTISAVALGVKESEKTQKLSATMLQQEKGKTVYFVFIGVAVDEEAASKDVRCILRDLMKLFYE